MDEQALAMMDSLHDKGFLRRNTPSQTFGMAPLLKAVIQKEARSQHCATVENATTLFVGHSLLVARDAAALEAGNAEVRDPGKRFAVLDPSNAESAS
jgi:hypothetical protein